MGKELSTSEDIVKQEMNTSFDYDKFRYFPTAAKPESNLHSEKDDDEEAAYLKPVEVPVTISSSVPWSVASTEAAGAKFRVRVVPTAETVRESRKIKKRIEVIKAERIAASKEREAKMKAMIAASGDAEGGGPEKEELAGDENYDENKNEKNKTN